MRGLDLPETWTVRVVSNRRSDTGAGEWIEPVLVVVESVKCLRSELERYSFGELEIFTQTHVPIVDPGAPQGVATANTELAGKWLAESDSSQVSSHTTAGGRGVRIRRDGIVEPVVDVLVESAWIRIADLGAALSERRQIKQIVVAKNREWESLLESGDIGNLPTADNQIQRLTHIAPKALAAPDWQLIDRTGYKAVINVEVRAAIIQTRVQFVHVACEGIGGTYAGSSGFVVEALRPRIYRQQRKRTSPPLQLQISGVVAGVAVIFAVQKTQNVVEVRIRLSSEEGTLSSHTGRVATRERIASGRIWRCGPLANIDPV